MMLHKNRHQKLLDLMNKTGLDGIALNPGPSLKYLTDLNFHIMERPFLLLINKNGKTALVLPELESSKLRESKIDLVGYPYGENPATWSEVFDQALQDLELKNKMIGVEPNHIRFLELQLLGLGLPGLKIVSASKILDDLRIIKDPSELEDMRKAAVIAQDAMTATIPFMKPGVTEKEIAFELSIQLLRAGSEPGFAFSPSVVSGPNSAKNHTGPGERRLQRGDLLIIDWGARYNGYASDITRTFAVEVIDPELNKIYEIVREANDAGKRTIKPGIPAGTVDQVTRKVIDDAGYGKYFFHRTGHGLGMEVHEPPYIYSENDFILDKGMTFTVEPGIYLDGIGGVRIEDDIVVTSDGCESLTDFNRDLIFLS